MWIIVLWSCIKIKRRGKKINKKMLMRCRTVPQVLKVGSPHVPEPAVESLSIVSQRGRFSFLTSHIRILYTLSQVLILNVLLPALIYRKTTVKSKSRSTYPTHHHPYTHKHKIRVPNVPTPSVHHSVQRGRELFKVPVWQVHLTWASSYPVQSCSYAADSEELCAAAVKDIRESWTSLVLPTSLPLLSIASILSTDVSNNA